MAKYGKVTAASFAGVSALGIGDTAAAFFGKRYGRYRIFRDDKDPTDKIFSRFETGVSVRPGFCLLKSKTGSIRKNKVLSSLEGDIYFIRLERVWKGCWQILASN